MENVVHRKGAALGNEDELVVAWARPDVDTLNIERPNVLWTAGEGLEEVEGTRGSTWRSQ